MANQLTIVRSVKTAVLVLGGPEAAARRFGRKGHQAAVNWVRRGAIPAVLRAKVEAALEGKGYEAHPSIFRRDALRQN
jgi:hypothetical protein